ncbi:MAG: lipoprotein insertase outer membrane protein LolB [Rubrivivax sp.]|nr:lipoprotein insertase outer membrane protein LolB [Rubrivivax sp.]
MIRRALPLLALALAMLTGCATPPRDTGEAPWISGRLSLRAQATATQAGQSLSAGFELQGDGQRGELRLHSPLGTRLATARWAPGLAVLATAEGESRFQDLDTLSSQALGEVLPLAALPDWLAGRPWAGAAHQDIEGGFEQLGWQIVLARRAEGWIEARRLAPPSVWLRVKLDEPA